MSTATQAFLAEASWQLAGTLEYERILERIGRLAVPSLASWCLIDVLEGDVVLRHVDCADHSWRETTRELAALPAEMHADGPIADVFRSGLSAQGVLADGEHELQALGGPGQAALLARLGLRAYLIVPLTSDEATLGTLTLLHESVHGLGLRDQLLAENFGRRAAQALATARLLRDRQAEVRARDELLAGLAHDLRDPLTAIRGYAQIVRAAADGDGPRTSRLRRAAERIEATALTVAGLLEELLDVSYARGTLKRQSVDLVRLVEDVADDWGTASDKHEIDLHVADAPLIGLWDGLRLYRVVNTLLSNALKYSPAGGDIRVTLAREDDPDGSAWARLEVTDHGLGIPAADLPRVFERAHRARNVRRIAGTGLGLAMSRELVEQHGGSIAVHSYEGLGSRFTVRLPLVG